MADMEQLRRQLKAAEEVQRRHHTRLGISTVGFCGLLVGEHLMGVNIWLSMLVNLAWLAAIDYALAPWVRRPLDVRSR